MKKWKDIVDMSPEQLEQAAAHIEVPQGLEHRIAEQVGQAARSQEILEPGSVRNARHVWLSVAGTAAAVAVIAGVALQSGRPKLKDTYDDPALAYAEVEKALLRSSEKMQYGTDVLSDSQDKMEKPLKMLER